MSTERSGLSRWIGGAVGVTLLIAAAGAATGFVWLPSLQAEAGFTGVWDAICSAAGVVRAPKRTAVVPASFKASAVVLTPHTLDGADAVSIGRGATLALQCTMCHGARGLSEANSPNLAGQYAAAVYKQIKDFKSGARTNAIMDPLVINLSDQDIRDLANYYAYLPRLPGFHPAGDGPAPQIVQSGAPMRNIPPCASCHGGVDYKAGSPWLEGEPVVYLRSQLEAFASGSRHNDISEQMRNIARGMSPAEMEAAAKYYGSSPKP
jgi:cytochrome c553